MPRVKMTTIPVRNINWAKITKQGHRMLPLFIFLPGGYPYLGDMERFSMHLGQGEKTEHMNYDVVQHRECIGINSRSTSDNSTCLELDRHSYRPDGLWKGDLV